MAEGSGSNVVHGKESSSGGGGGGGGSNSLWKNGNARTILLLPDLIIYWGIVQRYQKTFFLEGNEVGLMPNDVDGRIQFTQAGSECMLQIGKLMFRIYDAFQKKRVVTRDTLQRFLSDIHGEDINEKLEVKQVLERMFTTKENGNGGGGGGGDKTVASKRLMQLEETQFLQSLSKTVHVLYDGEDGPNGIEHILIDWFVRLSDGLMPRYLSVDWDEFYSCSPNGVGLGTLLKAKLDLVQNSSTDNDIVNLYETFDISDGGVGSSSVRKKSAGQMHLYEVKRRFQSIVSKGMEEKEKSSTRDHLDGKGNGGLNDNNIDDDDSSSLSSESSSIEEEGHNLPIDEPDENATPTKPLRNNDLPRNCIDEDTFVHTISTSDEDMGHGGFITKKLSQLLFRAGCYKAKERSLQQSSNQNYHVLENLGIAAMYKETTERCNATSIEKNHWDITDVVMFGCASVRGELISDDPDVPLFEYLFLMFSHLPSSQALDDSNIRLSPICRIDERYLSKEQIVQMIVLLLDQFSFRFQADAPLGDTDIVADLNNDSESGIVDASAASLLGLMPDSHQVGISTDSKSVSLDVLVDQVFKDVGKDSKDPCSCLTFQDFISWARATNDPNKSTEQAERKVYPLLLDLRLIGSIIFGIKPASPMRERIIIAEVKQRFKYKYPSKSKAKRGPHGTTWYIIELSWWKEWQLYTESAKSSMIGKICNENLLVENGSLALKHGLRLRYDFEVRYELCAIHASRYSLSHMILLLST
jgi:hypothetical protein